MAILKNTTISDTSSLNLPAGTTAQRPTSPQIGMIRYNTTIVDTEYYDGVAWRPLSDSNPEATGGTIVDTDIDGTPYRIHLFTNIGNSTFTVTKGGFIDYLIVGGGGGGGDINDSGGGGGGGVSFGSTTVTTQNYTVTVGAGGNRGVAGNGSSVTSIGTAGGGANGINTSFRQGGTSGSPQNNSGGGGGGSTIEGGGGGGAGGPGRDAITNAGIGGPGLFFGNIFTIYVGDGGWFASGGGGGGEAASPLNIVGGGGIGGILTTQDNRNAKNNTGGGGGGNNDSSAAGGNAARNAGSGGSGIVIIRYRRNQTPLTPPARTIIASRSNSYNIIQTGLIMHLDAANPISYPGTGNTWFDLSGNGYNGTLNNVTFIDSEAGGVLRINGSIPVISDIQFPTSPNLSESNYTVMVAQRYDSSGANERGRLLNGRDNNWLIGHWGNSVANHFAAGWVTAEGTGGTDDLYRIYTASGIGIYRFYINGVLNTSNTLGTAGPNGFIVGRYPPGTEYTNGRISFILVYNRILTDAEIAHNTNIFRLRY